MGTRTPAAVASDRQWHIIDAKGQVLGRVASRAARLLQGKHKPAGRRSSITAITSS